MKSRIALPAGKNPLIVAMAALQSVILAALLLVSAYDGARQPLAQSRLAFSPAALAVEPGAIGKQDGLRQLFASEQHARTKARLIDPPDLDLCRTVCLSLPGQVLADALVLADLVPSAPACCGFQPRAPPQVIL